ncbi:MAG: type III-B CRISPR module RAMP protein Cmr4, partial [Thermus sp.]|nr:type III-B CRISPR module RAMP protein Cmr4 [Thermus sp.]
GSSLKGVLRDRAKERGWDDNTLFAVFGPETQQASEHAGAVQVGDARLLFLPVRSLYGVFALVTSPYLLERFQREALLAGLTLPPLPKNPAREGIGVAPDSMLVHGGKVYLEDLDLMAQEDPALAEWESWFSGTEVPVKRRLALVHDDLMAYLMETATEVVARIRLDDQTKTVARGALWYEESLPAESVLYSLVRAEKSRRKGQELAAEGVLSMFLGLLEGAVQLGGKATVGRGLSRLKPLGR